MLLGAALFAKMGMFDAVMIMLIVTVFAMERAWEKVKSADSDGQLTDTVKRGLLGKLRKWFGL